MYIFLNIIAAGVMVRIILTNKKIKQGLKRIGRGIKFAINSIWIIPAIVLVRLIRPWIFIRFRTIDSSRIGHFLADSSIYLARQDLRSRHLRILDVFWFAKPSCNAQWARMVRRQLTVRWWVPYMIRMNELIPGGRGHIVPPGISSGNRDIYNVLNESSERFRFSKHEDEKAKLWLFRKGWREGEAFVCLAVRDSAYLALDPLHTSKNPKHWDYHNYRDSDIDRYVDTVQTLLDRGYWVIRMGKFANSRLSINHNRVIDYPFVSDQDDLMDIWLGAHCRFFVSSGTGIDTTPTIYGKYVVFVNSLPLSLIFSSVKQIWVPKHLRWLESGRLLNLREHFQHGYTSTGEYEQAGIAIEELSPGEITNAVVECEKRIDGSWVQSEEDQALQQRFWNLLREVPNSARFHGTIHSESRVGAAWLKSMGEGFFD